jgi:hypothetical protein
MTTGTVAYGHATSKPVELTCRYQLEIGESFEGGGSSGLGITPRASWFRYPTSPSFTFGLFFLTTRSTWTPIIMRYLPRHPGGLGMFASLGRVQIVLQPCNHDPATGEEVAKQREFNPRRTRQIHPMPDDGISAEAYLLSDPRTIQR